MGEVTHEQAKLMLQLYEMRREPRMREAREWYFTKFIPASMEDVGKMAPMGSKENASMRMVLSYWAMVASIVNRGLIDEEFFFENSGEQWFVYERIKALVPTMRERSKNPQQYAGLETHVNHYEAWREKRAPGSTAAQRLMMAQMTAPPAKSGGKKKAKGK
jgi:hypothetical protein